MKKMLEGKVIYLICCGANKTKKLEELIDLLAYEKAEIYVFPTDNSMEFIKLSNESPKYKLCFEKKGDATQKIPEENIVVVAPCTFNTFNKIAFGIADSYSLSIIQNAIGNGKKCIIAPSMNINFWNHKTTQKNLTYLKEFQNINVIYPETIYNNMGEIDRLTMAPFEKVIDTICYESSKIKFDNEQEDMNIYDDIEKNFPEFYLTGKFLQSDNYLNGTAGFLSKRIDSGILITRSGSSVGSLTMDDLVLIRNFDKHVIKWSGKTVPSSESPLALDIFNKFNCNVVIHGHCKDITYDYNKDKYKSNDYVRYGEWGELKKIKSELLKYKVAILKLHGEIIIADNFYEACMNYEAMRNTNKDSKTLIRR